MKQMANDFMDSIFEEELNPVNLSERARKVLELLEVEIRRLERGDERNPPTLEGNKKLKFLTEDYQGLVKETREKLKNPSLKTKPIVDKLEANWRYIYSRMRRYDELVIEYNKTHNPKLEFISKRTGDKIEESVNYFDY